VPRNLGEVTPQWLESALRASGALMAGSVRSVVVTPFAVGVGLMSQVARLDVTYAGSHDVALPARFVVKLAAEPGPNRAMALEYGLYEREVRFYRELAPTAGITTPVAFVADHDPRSGDMVLVLEDLSIGGATSRDDVVSDEDVGSLAQALAGFHATWWTGMGRVPPEWVPTLDGPVWAQQQSMFRPAWDAFGRSDQAADRPQFLAFGATLVEAIPALQRRLASAPSTLVHFDLRLSNVLITRPTAGGSSVGFVDWQPLTVARGPYDLALFLSQSIPTDQRRSLESDTLATYHRALIERGVSGYSFDDVWDDYRLSVAYTANYAVATTLVDLGNDAGRRFARRIVERAAAAVDDLDVESAVRHAVGDDHDRRRRALG